MMERNPGLGEFGELAAVGARWCIGLVFLMSGASKIRRRADFNAFRASVAALLPRWGRDVRRLPEAVLMLELAVAPLLLVPGQAWLGFALAIMLLVAFTVAIAAARARGVRAPCRCFGGSAAPLGVRHLVRNTLLAAIGAVGLLSGSTPGHRAAATTAMAAGIGLVAAVVFVILDDIVDAFAHQPTTVEHIK